MHRILIALSLCTAQSALAADWATVSRDQGRVIEIDRASILVSDAGTKVAWGRVTLPRAEAISAGYASVNVLNRYDCRSQSFTTIKRVYQDAAGVTSREETVPAGSPPVRIKPGSLDDRFYKEVCKPISVAQLGAIANAAVGQADRKTGMRLVKQEVTDVASPPAREVPPRTPPAPAERLRNYAPPPARPTQVAIARAATSSRQPTHWSYEGAGGPSHWAELKPEYAVCGKGQRQSPIDIRDGIPVENEALGIDYRPSYFRIADNGHSIQADLGTGLFLKTMGRNYELQQVHFHRPAEEKIDGRSFEMSAHLVHKDADGRIAVIAVLIERGTANPMVQTLWNNLPLEKYESYAPAASIDPVGLLPKDPRYYAYMGSLTTPPCTEGVLWLVMKQPIQLSPEQISVFSRFYNNNARPVQPLAGRTIKESR